MSGIFNANFLGLFWFLIIWFVRTFFRSLGFLEFSWFVINWFLCVFRLDERMFLGVMELVVRMFGIVDTNLFAFRRNMLLRVMEIMVRMTRIMFINLLTIR